MRFDLFSVPIFIGDIDCNKINLQNKGFKKTFLSDTVSSHDFFNELDDESKQYLLTVIANLIKNNFFRSHKIILQSIWQNNYEEGDFQEKHIHQRSHFSFIIYKQIDESKTIFYNPAFYPITSFYDSSFLTHTNFFKTDFKPMCKTNQIIVFPSFLEHMVRKNTKKSITISGNVLIEMV
jgi:hypothetical protein|tara:strand:+ start:71 stop:607 length:537 start_codon:yes stop_codon:yes gene_type:complete